MGQASRRGSFEARKAQAIAKQEEELRIKEVARRARLLQEAQAWDTMVWWQIEMTERRERIKRRRETELLLTLASIFGMAYGGSW